jgi:hypothetical protein
LEIIEETKAQWVLLKAGHCAIELNQMGKEYDYWLCDGEDPEENVFQLKQKKK